MGSRESLGTVVSERPQLHHQPGQRLHRLPNLRPSPPATIRGIPDADVRIDQCDDVRIFWRGRDAYICEREEYGIEVPVTLWNDPDEDPSVVGSPRIVDRRAFSE